MTAGGVEDTEEYKRIYAKYAGRAPNPAARANVEAGGGGYTSYAELTGEKASIGYTPSNVPDIEDADPNETPAASIAAPRINVSSEKLDQYRICRRCQGMGEFKEYIPMGNGCTREVVKMCDEDIDGSPCDGGIVLKNWKPGMQKQAEPATSKPSYDSSDGKFAGTSEPSAETQRERKILDDQREQAIEKAMVGEEPLHQITMLPCAEEDEEPWLEAKVMLPLVSSAQEIDAFIEHMRFLHVQVAGLYTLKAELPEYVDDEDMECTFDTSTHTLKVCVPVVST